MATAATEFIPEVYAAGVEHALNEEWVIVDICNRNYEGEIKKQGDSVRIKTVGRITAHSLTRATKRTELTAAEEIEGDTIIFPINQIRYTHVFVDSIDELATDVNLMNESAKETAVALAAQHDKYAAEIAYKGATNKLAVIASLNPDNIVDTILEAKTKLYEKNVSRNAALELVVTPEIEAVLVKAAILTKSNNVEDFKNGKIGMTLGVNVRVSNNVYLDSGNKGCFMTTKDAVAFAEQVSKTITYREDGKYLDRDIIKTYTLFDAKVIWADRIIGIPVTATSLKTA